MLGHCTWAMGLPMSTPPHSYQQVVAPTGKDHPVPPDLRCLRPTSAGRVDPALPCRVQPGWLEWLTSPPPHPAYLCFPIPVMFSYAPHLEMFMWRSPHRYMMLEQEHCLVCSRRSPLLPWSLPVLVPELHRGIPRRCRIVPAQRRLFRVVACQDQLAPMMVACSCPVGW